MQPENRSATVVQFPAKGRPRPQPEPQQPSVKPMAGPSDVRTQIFNTVRFISYERVNEVATIEELQTILAEAIVQENARYPEALRLKEYSIDELAKSLAAWSWKNKRKPKVAIPALNAEEALDHALTEIRVLGPYGPKVFGLLQLFRANHAGVTFLIQPERMRASRYGGAAWTVKAYKDARDILLAEGFIRIVEKDRGRPVKYALAERKLTDQDRKRNADMFKAASA